MSQRDLFDANSDVRQDDQARVIKVRGDHALPEGSSIQDSVTRFLSDNSEALPTGWPG